MTQRYKVFVNGIPLILNGNEPAPQHDDGTMFYRHSDIHSLELLVQLLERHPRGLHRVWLTGDSPDQVWNDFLSLHKYVEAAGGRVHNPAGEPLLIFRDGIWDLPKGHVEKGETVEAAALREVEEECGTRHLEIGKALPPTFHTYQRKGKRYLKKTYWFEMRCDDRQPLVPQAEEHITEVCWADKKRLEEILKNIYPSIAEVLQN